jgi:hypothetical protein
MMTTDSSQLVIQPKVPLQTFARDLWEAMRSESREQLGDSITDEMFNRHLPPWDGLALSAREAKMLLARDELLRVLDRAGYEVRQKGKRTTS